jgi:predicted transglutaminase-like cysteine proteinase
MLLLVGYAILLARSPTGYGDLPVRMPNGNHADAPRGLTAMCSSRPTECAQFSNIAVPSAKLAETDKMALLNQVNRRVNHRVAEATDKEIFDSPEIWRRAGSGKAAIGDCEDIALEKLYQLLTTGFPSKDLFLAIGYARPVGLHTVLIGRTSEGDYVLDNRSSKLVLWNRTPYSWIVRQKPGELTSWVSVSAPQHQAPETRMAKDALAKGAPTTG